MSGRKKKLWAGAVFIAVLLSAFFLFREAGRVKYPLIVNEEPITQEELEFYDGDKDRAVRARVIWDWAEQEKIIDRFSYDSFLEALDKENKERKALHEKGEPVCGPVEFTPMQYYKRLIGECEQALKERIMERTTPEELEVFYETYREHYRQVDSFTAQYTVWQEGKIIYEGIVELNDSNVRAMTEADEELANKLLQLEEGGQTNWTGSNGEEKQLICTKREAGEYLLYEEVSGAVLEQCAAEKFEKELNEKISKSEIQDFR